jgi:hypothetical protein
MASGFPLTQRGIHAFTLMSCGLTGSGFHHVVEVCPASIPMGQIYEE